MDDLNPEQKLHADNINLHQELKTAQVLIIKLPKCTNTTLKLNQWMETYGYLLSPIHLRSLYLIMEQETGSERQDINTPYQYFNVKTSDQKLFANFIKLGLAERLEVIYLCFENNLVNQTVNL